MKFERLLLTAFATFPRSHRVFRESMRRWVTDKLWIKPLIRDRLEIDPRRRSCSASTTCRTRQRRSSARPSTRRRSSPSTAPASGRPGPSGSARAARSTSSRRPRFPHSLGLLYSAFTAYCGFEVNEGEYKLMGMAPYGQPRYVDKVKKMIQIGADGSYWLDLDYFAFHYSPDTTMSSKFSELIGRPPRDPALGDKSLDPFYCDVAASIQVVTEEVDDRARARGAAPHRAEEPLPLRRSRAQLGRQHEGASRRGLRADLHPARARRRRRRDRRGALGLPSSARQATRVGARSRLPRQRVRREPDRRLPEASTGSRTRSSTTTSASSTASSTISWPARCAAGMRGRFEFGPRALGCALDHRRPAPRRDEGDRQREDQVPRGVPSVRAERAGGALRGVLRAAERAEPLPRALHAVRGPGPGGQARGDPRDHARRRIGTATDGRQGDQPVLPPHDRAVRSRRPAFRSSSTRAST